MNISELARKHFDNNKAALGFAAGVSRQAVCQWRDSDMLKAEYVIPVCESLEWKISPHTLRPDIYPNAADGLPAKAA